MRLDDTLLEEFVQGFYGYDNLSAPCWFVGMEEGGGNSAEDRDAIAPARIAHLRASISRYRPKLVLFYGMPNRQLYEQIAATPFATVTELSSSMLLGKKEGTSFVIFQHPSAHGVTHQYFEMIGMVLRERK